MNGTKSPYQSIGLVAGVATAIVGAGQLLGYAIDPADAQQLSDAIFGGVTVVTGIAAAIGRIRASRRIAFRG